MYSININLVIHFYIDTSGFTTSIVIIQFQELIIVDLPNTKVVKVPIIYNLFTFTTTRRKYLTYKRELYTIVTFITKYNYLYKYPYHPTIVYTDYKLLIYFLLSNLYKGIYEHQANQLRRLNISIIYVPGHRNKIANALLRTLFKSLDYSKDVITRDI